MALSYDEKRIKPGIALRDADAFVRDVRIKRAWRLNSYRGVEGYYASTEEAQADAQELALAGVPTVMTKTEE